MDLALQPIEEKKKLKGVNPVSILVLMDLALQLQ